MEYKDGTNKYKMFESIHRPQLESLGVPNQFWFTLYKKIEKSIFDAGNVFSIFRIDYGDDKKAEDPVYTVLVTKPDGIYCDDSSQIYLIDHAWTYESSKATQNLLVIPGLVDRMCNLMGLSVEDDLHKNVENVCKEMWRYNQTYSPGFGNAENRIPVWYIMDELGSAIEHSDKPNFKTVPFFYINEQITYSLLFPLKNVENMEKVTRDYLEGPFTIDENLRKALIFPWKPSSFLDLSFFQIEPNESYFTSENTKEILPDIQNPLVLDTSKVLKVYTEYDVISNFLRNPSFQLVDSPSDADILWLTKHIKNYKCYSEESSLKLLNQFPYESVLTMKNFLAIICRRKQRKDLDDFADNPPWFPVTYDLSGELDKFVSYYQHQEKNKLSNLWICKPWNLARSLDITITNNINCIVRLPSTGPKLAQRYVFDPLLFYREGVGNVKFDIRYVVLLKSVQPLQVYAYKNFFLRFANKAFDLTDFWDREKHFTVMNYNEETPLFEMLCDEFIEKFNRQYPDLDWKLIEKEIFKVFRELFEAASCKPPPMGIAHNNQSRALYAVDLILTLDKSQVQPKILEVNWLPDCERACQYYPTFFDDVFLLLFKDECNKNLFLPL